jgi:hypothetical protein
MKVRPSSDSLIIILGLSLLIGTCLHCLENNHGDPSVL